MDTDSRADASTSHGPEPAPMRLRPPRADAGRNRQALLDAASELFRRDGANASLEAIALRAGVGPATLHRHFAGRPALLRAVYADHVATLAQRASTIALESSPDLALRTWLVEIAHHCADNVAILHVIDADRAGAPDTALDVLVTAGEPLRRLGIEAGAVDPDVRLDDMLVLVNAVVTSAQADIQRVDRLLALAFRGMEAAPA